MKEKRPALSTGCWCLEKRTKGCRWDIHRERTKASCWKKVVRVCVCGGREAWPTLAFEESLGSWGKVNVACNVWAAICTLFREEQLRACLSPSIHYVQTRSCLLLGDKIPLVITASCDRPTARRRLNASLCLVYVLKWESGCTSAMTLHDCNIFTS